MWSRRGKGRSLTDGGAFNAAHLALLGRGLWGDIASEREGKTEAAEAGEAKRKRPRIVTR